jgi:hypothetical protein
MYTELLLMTKLLVMWIINLCNLCFTDGQLRKIDPNTGEPGNEPFEFHVTENQDYNQKRYEALGDVSVLTAKALVYIHAFARVLEQIFLLDTVQNWSPPCT